MENEIPFENHKNVIILFQLLKVFTKYRNNADGNTANAPEVYAPQKCLSLLIRISNIYMVLEWGRGVCCLDIREIRSTGNSRE